MVSALLSNSSLEELHNEVKIKMNGRVLHFIVFINHTYLMESSREAALGTSLEETFTHSSVVADMLSDELMDR